MQPIFDLIKLLIMENQEKYLVKLNTEIIEVFDENDEMLLVKGGKGIIEWLIDKLEEGGGHINLANCINCSCTSNNNC